MYIYIYKGFESESRCLHIVSLYFIICSKTNNYLDFMRLHHYENDIYIYICIYMYT